MDATEVVTAVQTGIVRASRLAGHDTGRTSGSETVVTSDDLLSGRVVPDGLWRLPSLTHGLPAETPCHHPFGRPIESSEFVQPLRFTYRSEYVSEWSNVRLLGPGGIGVTRDGRILEDTVSFPYEDHERLDAFLKDAHMTNPLTSYETRFTRRRSEDHVSRSLPIACPLYGWGDNYYHWLIENLPALRAVEHYTAQTGRAPTLILPPDPPSFVTDSLALLGVDRHATVEWRGPAIDVSRLVLPAFPEPTADNLHWLRTRFRGAVGPEATSETPDRIYVSRANTSRRRVRNEGALLDTLGEFGFERVFAEELRVTDQIELFGDASVILSPHGAGLSNVIWADDATVIELHNNHVREHYYVLANNVGLEYIPIESRSTDPEEMDSDMVVDTERVERTLAGALSEG